MQWINKDPIIYKYWKTSCTKYSNFTIEAREVLAAKPYEKKFIWLTSDKTHLPKCAGLSLVSAHTKPYLLWVSCSASIFHSSYVCEMPQIGPAGISWQDSINPLPAYVAKLRFS